MRVAGRTVSFIANEDAPLNTAELAGASYAEARAVEARSQQLEVKNRRVSALHEGDSRGLGVRVLDEKGLEVLARGASR